MNEDTLRTADLWRTRGDEVALATVVRTRRSAPRPLGSKFAVGSRGEMAGSVSGGCVEGAVVGEAQSVLKGGPPKLVFYGIGDLHEHLVEPHVRRPRRHPCLRHR